MNTKNLKSKGDDTLIFLLTLYLLNDITWDNMSILDYIFVTVAAIWLVVSIVHTALQILHRRW